MKFEWNDGRLTERDKKLIVWLSVVVILVVGIYFVIRPLISDIHEMKSEINNQQELKSDNEGKITLLNQYEKLEDVYKSQVDELSAAYYPIMESDDIDHMLTQAALDKRLTCIELSIYIEDNMQDLPPYVNSSISDESDNDSIDFCSGIYTAEVEMRLSGTKSNLQSFLDEQIVENPAKRVTEYNWNVSEGISELTVSLELYMSVNAE